MPPSVEWVPQRVAGAWRPSVPGAWRRMSLRMRVFAVAVLLLATGLGWLALRDSSLFAVENVAIDGLPASAQPVVVEELQTAAREQTTTDFSLAAVRSEVAQYTVIAGLRAQTHFPHGVTLIVTARHAVARLVVDGVTLPVDAQGRVITGLARTVRLPTVEAAHMPVRGVTQDAFALVALRVLADGPPLLRRRVIAITPAQGLTIYLHAGPRLIFGNPELAHAKWDSATAVLATHSARGATYINVTVPSRPAAQVGDAATTGLAPAKWGSGSAASNLSTAALQQ
jgi:cell division protein FtsQ